MAALVSDPHPLAAVTTGADAPDDDTPGQESSRRGQGSRCPTRLFGQDFGQGSLRTVPAMRSDATGTPPPERVGRHTLSPATASVMASTSPEPPTTGGGRRRCLHEPGPELAFGARNLERVLARLRLRQHAAQLTGHRQHAARVQRPATPPAETGPPGPASGVAPTGSVPSVRSRTPVARSHDRGPTTSQEQT